MFVVLLFKKAKGENTQVTMNKGIDKQTVVCTYHGILCIYKK